MSASKRAANFAPSKKDLNPIEIASHDEIAALQLRRMKWSLKHAYENVRHYQKSFDAAGVHPDDLRRLEDLAKFPFTTKQDLREHYPFGMFAVPQEEIVRLLAIQLRRGASSQGEAILELGRAGFGPKRIADAFEDADRSGRCTLRWP